MTALAPSGTTNYSMLEFTRVTLAPAQVIVVGRIDTRRASLQAFHLYPAKLDGGVILNVGEYVGYQLTMHGAGKVLPAGKMIVAYTNTSARNGR